MPGGRPSKRTPEIRDRLLSAIGKGLTYDLACAASGLCYDTFNEWRKADAEFSEAVKRAEGAGAEQLLDTIRAASAENWTAAAWILERRYPHLYGRRVQEIHGRDGGPVEFKVTWPTAKPEEGGT